MEFSPGINCLKPQAELKAKKRAEFYHNMSQFRQQGKYQKAIPIAVHLVNFGISKSRFVHGITAVYLFKNRLQML